MTQEAVNRVGFSPDGRTLAAGFSGRSAYGYNHWDVMSQRQLGKRLIQYSKVPAPCVVFEHHRKIFAASDQPGGGVTLWDQAGKRHQLEMPPDVAKGLVSSMAFSPDGRTLATGLGFLSSRTGGVALWDTAAEPRFERLLDVPEGGVHAVAFSPDGRALAAGTHVERPSQEPSGVILWDTTGRRRLTDRPLAVPEGAVWTVAFSPDSQLLASSFLMRSSPSGVVLWDAARRSRVTGRPLEVPEGLVHTVAFSPDCRILATGYNTSLGSGVVLWDVAGRRRLDERPLEIPNGRITAMEFSPDNRTLASGVHVAQNSDVLLWDVLPVACWPSRARQIANRNLSWDEWQAYLGPDAPYHRTFDDLPDGEGFAEALKARDKAKRGWPLLDLFHAESFVGAGVVGGQPAG